MTYRELTGEHQLALRRERVAFLEADLFRAEMQLEEAQSDDERSAVRADIEAFRSRLSVHYNKLSSASTESAGEHG
jgi:hypothetical protein